jgi:carbonic anhydrase/acetyltransferase-like protein (isoleucine patch superfamily)
MGAIVMNGAVIGTGSMVGAGALVPAGVVIPARSLVVGAPGKVRRETTQEEVGGIELNATFYVELASTHRAG